MPDSQDINFYALIFSKDRAAQLDSLLRSVRDHVAVPLSGISVLYKASDNSFNAGYERLKSRNILPGIKWIPEQSFKTDCISLFASFPEKSLVCTLVDDDVFFRPFDTTAVLKVFSHSHHCAISLITYPSDVQRTPGIRRMPEYFEWQWARLIKPRGYRMYPFCLDAFIYSRDLLLRLLPRLDFKAPNSLEGELNHAKRRLMVWRRGRSISTLTPCVFNNPLNSVQIEGGTWNQDVSTERINAQYCAGFEIDNKDLYSAKPDHCHFPVPVKFIKS
jgi:hypothetical protein